MVNEFRHVFQGEERTNYLLEEVLAREFRQVLAKALVDYGLGDGRRNVSPATSELRMFMITIGCILSQTRTYECDALVR